MYTIVVDNGIVLETKGAVKSLLKARPAGLTLVWQQHLECEAGEHNNDIPVVDLPPGDYYVWQGQVGFQLVVLPDMWIIDTTVIMKPTGTAQSHPTLSDVIRRQLHNQLAGSNINVAVYGNAAAPANWNYKLVDVSSSPPPMMGQKPLLGIADTETGIIR